MAMLLLFCVVFYDGFGCGGDTLQNVFLYQACRIRRGGGQVCKVPPDFGRSVNPKTTIQMDGGILPISTGGGLLTLIMLHKLTHSL